MTLSRPRWKHTVGYTGASDMVQLQNLHMLNKRATRSIPKWEAGITNGSTLARLDESATLWVARYAALFSLPDPVHIRPDHRPSLGREVNVFDRGRYRRPGIPTDPAVLSLQVASLSR